MSVTMTKGEGVTVFTVKSDSKSDWPLLCQILGTMCYSPVCSLSQRLRTLQGSSQSALGVIQIMVGLLNIGLGAVITGTSSGPLSWEGVPFWLGGVFIAVGFMCILAEKFPSPCLVGINVMMNLIGAALAITGIVFYAIDLSDGFTLGYLCYSNYDWEMSYESTEPPSDIQQRYMERCKAAKRIAVIILKALDIMLIVFVVLQLCVTISSAVLGIKSLKRSRKEKKKTQDPELYNPLLEEVKTDAAA